MENEAAAALTQQDIDIGIRSQALHLAQAQFERVGHWTPEDLIGAAQHYEAYIREGRTLHPTPSQAKAA